MAKVGATRTYLSGMDATWYPIIKALHIIFMVTYFAGTFYIVRLFIYHKEALAKFEPDRTILSRQLIVMERKLWYIITWPSLVLLFIFGLWMFAMNPMLIKEPWMHAKLGFVALLVAYHFKNQTIFRKARINDIPWSSFRLRLWNEGATIVLIAVVFLAELKQLDVKYGLIGLLVLGLVLGLAVVQYRKKRQTTREVSNSSTNAPV